MMSLLQLKSLREPRANQISTTIFFHSPKLNRQVWCESNLEWDTAIILDQDPSVLEYCEQSIELQWSKSTWIPDFVALIEEDEQYTILILEVKYMQELLEDKEHFIQKYDETRDWITQNFSMLATSFTKLPISRIELIIVTDLVLQQSFRVRNCRKLIQAIIENSYDFQIAQNIRDIMRGVAFITLESLVKSINALKRNNTYSKEGINSTLFTMMYKREIQIDLESLITPKSTISLDFQSNSNLEVWLKRYNWRNQSFTHTPLIEHNDLYFIAKTPEKSIEYWNIASSRLETIIPLLKLSVEQLKSQEIIYEGKKIFWMTAYQWILKYKEVQGDIRALLPKFSECGRKSNYTGPIHEELWEYGKKQYLQLERKSIKQAYNYMESYAYAQNKGKYCMSYSTFYRHIKTLHGKEVAQKRIGKRNAEKDFELSESEFPHADFPLQSVQIDHTPIDVLVVDEENRQVTERPYLTIAFDSHSRCVLGYYLTYNKPSRLSVAMTLFNCVQNKADSIKKIHEQFPQLDESTQKIIQESKWQEVYGLPYTLHMDNGSDFRSHDIRLFGARYKVHLHYRAVKKPQHGAYVERFLGTLNHRLQGIAGTTFSNVKARREYPSEKRAIYTIKELEARLLTEILLYHEDYHRQIRMSPIKKWLDAFSPSKVKTAISHNTSQLNLEYFHLDLLPSEMRSVQKQGVQMFNLGFSDPRIQKWIGAKVLGKHSKRREFLIRYDPRDIRIIYFYDPEEKGYYTLKCSDRFVQTYFKGESLSLWQWKAIKRAMKDAYRYSKNSPEIKKRAYFQIQDQMDRETALRSKSVRIKRSRELFNSDDINGKVKSTNNLFNDDSDLAETDSSSFDLSVDEDIEYVYIPPEKQNPFYGMTEKMLRDNEEGEEILNG